MPTIYNLRASNNQTFHFTRDLSQWAALYPIAQATIRMQARLTPDAPDPPAYEWVSTNTANGQVQFSAASNLCVFLAPEADMAALCGDYSCDCRLELPGGESVLLFAGRLRFSPGVTRAPSDPTAQTGVAGLGDTVVVLGEVSNAPVPLPLSLSAAVATVQALMFPTNLALDYSTPGEALLTL